MGQQTRSGRPTVGMLTIGQAPRPDIVGAFDDLDADILEGGALDGLTAAQVQAEASPTPDDVAGDRTVYVTRLADGTEVKVLKSYVTNGLQQRIDELAPRCDLIAVLCTGTFPTLESPVPLVLPDQVLQERVEELGATDRLHVVMPAPEQREFMEGKWAPVVRSLSLDSASPYQPFDAAAIVAAAVSGPVAPQAIALDCMGFRAEHRQALEVALVRAGHQDIPVVLSQEAVAHAVQHALGNVD
ncbi:AroM family protein [Galactobacter sp.]|uniref:AroM family protein n=1 Tax=Galactobacter sp. TaxID=2676125 RepID=UPI0025BA1CB6|nr:AroM family protein [Galactobacter sp.]